MPPGCQIMNVATCLIHFSQSFIGEGASAQYYVIFVRWLKNAASQSSNTMNRTSPPVPLNPNPILWINLNTLKTSGNTAARKIGLRLRSATAGSHCYTQPAFPIEQISALHLLLVFAHILHSPCCAVPAKLNCNKDTVGGSAPLMLSSQERKIDLSSLSSNSVCEHAGLFQSIKNMQPGVRKDVQTCDKLTSRQAEAFEKRRLHQMKEANGGTFLLHNYL